MFPGAFIDGGKEAEKFIVVAEIVEEVGGGADKRDNNNTGDGEPDRHILIIAPNYLVVVWAE